MMKNTQPLENPELDRASLFVLMIPVIGFFPPCGLFTVVRAAPNAKPSAAWQLPLLLVGS